jgi:hypothetical protein
MAALHRTPFAPRSLQSEGVFARQNDRNHNEPRSKTRMIVLDFGWFVQPTSANGELGMAREPHLELAGFSPGSSGQTVEVRAATQAGF